MDWNGIASVISSLGFPIVMCIILVWYIKDSNDKQRQQIKEINDQHSSEMSGITEALNNNTLVIQKLCDKMDLINAIQIGNAVGKQAALNTGYSIWLT